MKCSQELYTVFQKTEISEPALFSPSEGQYHCPRVRCTR